MEDFSDKLSQILSSPETMDTLKNLAGMLGGGGGEPSDQPPAAKAAMASPSMDMGGINPELIGKLLPLLSQFHAEDSSTRLLAALRPHLSEERRARLDRAAQMLRLARMLPLLKEQGLLKGLLGGG